MIDDLSARSNLIVAKNLIGDQNGKALAIVRRPRTFPICGWFRWFVWRHRSRRFQLVDENGGLLLSVQEGGVRMGRFRLDVNRADGTPVGAVTARRTGITSGYWMFYGMTGGILGQARFTSKARYGEILKKLTFEFRDTTEQVCAKAEQKVEGSPPFHLRFQKHMVEEYRLLALCFMLIQPSKRLSESENSGADTLKPRSTELADSPFGREVGMVSLVFHRDELKEDGRTVARIAEPSVPLPRGLSRVLSHNPAVTTYSFEVCGPAGDLLFKIHKTAGARRYTISVELPDGVAIGSIRQSSGVFKTAYQIYDGAELPAGTIEMTSAASSNYVVIDASSKIVARIDRYQAVDEPWDIRMAADIHMELRNLAIAFVVVQEIILDL